MSLGKTLLLFLLPALQAIYDIILLDQSIVRDFRGRLKDIFGLTCVVVTVRLRALKAKIAAHKKELDELDKNVYVSRPPFVRTKERSFCTCAIGV